MSGKKKFSHFQRELVKQLVLEAEVQRFTREETLDLVKSRLKANISIESLDVIKRNLKRNADQPLRHMRKHKTAFLDQLFFKRVHEMEMYQKVLWRVIHANNNNGFLQKACITELHSITTDLARMWDALPQISGLTFFTTAGESYSGQRDISSALNNNSHEQDSSAETTGNYEPIV